VMVGDLGLETTPIGFGDAVAEDRAELVGTTDAAIEVQQAFSHSIQSANFEGGTMSLTQAKITDQAVPRGPFEPIGLKGKTVAEADLKTDNQLCPRRTSSE